MTYWFYPTAYSHWDERERYARVMNSGSTSKTCRPTGTRWIDTDDRDAGGVTAMTQIDFPEFSGLRCLMMPYIQGDPTSVPDAYASYADIIDSVFLRRGDIGFLTIDESPAIKGKPHRGARSRYDRALHTEAGRRHTGGFWWGSWGDSDAVRLDRNVRILLANNLDGSCAAWDAEHEDTSLDGDIGYAASDYPYSDAVFFRAGEVREISILTPHESLPVSKDFNRQFLRIVSSGVHGREEYFTRNPLVPFGGI